MPLVRLGKTEITVEKNAFGALPIQRISQEQAVKLLRAAYDGGMRYFDTARAYSDSEQKLGEAFAGCREKLFIATKTMAKTAAEFWADLAASLAALRTDYIDVYQFHNPPFCPRPGDGSGLYEAMCEAKAEGKIRHIGITNHRIAVAHEAIASGLYALLQFPLSYLASPEEQQLPALCAEADMGFVCMKGLAGGLINDYRPAYAYIAQFENALPIWGIEKAEQLAQFLSCVTDPPVLDDALRDIIARDREQLSGSFCRACGYCLPCPAGIDIPTCARMALLLGRAPVPDQTTPAMRAKMESIESCINCRHCATHCPYSLDTPALLRENLAFYRNFLAQMA